MVTTQDEFDIIMMVLLTVGAIFFGLAVYITVGMLLEKEKDTIKETLTCSNYEVREARQSQIDPEVTISVVVGMMCPRCKTARDEIDHGKKAVCSNCGLKMKVHGNAIMCEG